MDRVSSTPNRVLIVDDNTLIHDDFRKVLSPHRPEVMALDAFERILFGDRPQLGAELCYDLGFALQGQEAVHLARGALAEGRPYRLAFIDMRMPPGWDGLRTMIELRKVDANLQFVVCSAFSDYDVEEVNQRLGIKGSLLHLPKPFSPDDIREVAFILGTQPETQIT